MFHKSVWKIQNQFQFGMLNRVDWISKSPSYSHNNRLIGISFCVLYQSEVHVVKSTQTNYSGPIIVLTICESGTILKSTELKNHQVALIIIDWLMLTFAYCINLMHRWNLNYLVKSTWSNYLSSIIVITICESWTILKSIEFLNHQVAFITSD